MITGCEDIQASINERCAAMGIDADMVEFALVDFTLLVCADSRNADFAVDSKGADSGKSGAFKPLSKAESSQLDIQAQYNQSLFLLKQKCDVRVFPRRFPATFFITVSAQKDRVFLSFDDGFLCVDDASFYEEFFSQVEAMMAANGVILYDLANTRARIREVLARINADPKAKSGMFCIKQSEVFIPPKSARFVFLPKERYLKSRYIQSLMQTESIAEHITKHMGDMDSNDIDSHAKSSTESSDLDSSANADSSQNAPRTLSAPESSAPQTLATSNADYLDDAKFACAFFGVREGEVVGIYELGDEGKAGRDLTGVYRKAAPKPPKITPSAQKHITYKLYDDRIEYISEVQGYIALHSTHTAPFTNANTQSTQNSAANIKDESDNGADSVFVFFFPDFAPLKSTTTPPLLGGIEADISLVIESKNDAIDALGDNIHIEAKNIEIYGSLGKDTAIKADELIINGATHHSSKTHAKIAKILTHKGLMICEKCTIKNLESGKVFADDARVIQANGSKIYAKNISIKALRNNNHCHFSKTLQIQEIPYNKGNDNMLAFDVKGDRELRAYIKRALKYANDKQSTLKILAQMIDFYAASTRDAQVFLQKLQGFTKDQLEIALKNQDFAAKNLTSINAIKLYKALLARQKSLKKRLETLQDKTLPSLQTALKNATIQIGLVGGFENYAHLECDFPHSSQNMLLLSGKSACVRLEPASQELKEKGIYFQLKAEE